jgi:signal transduction histidine kinase
MTNRRTESGAFPHSFRNATMCSTPAALATFLIAAFFGWSIARRLIQLRLEGRVVERLRIARALHDTLLQSFQGVILHLHALTFILDRPAEVSEKLLEGDGRGGHFGSAGMRERAKVAGGKLTVRTKLDCGTEIELTIPASLAYAKSTSTEAG